MRSLALVAALALPGCATLAAPPCPGNARAQLRAELILGRTIGTGGMVGDAAWRRFLADEVTPRFPDGFTELDASGQWRKPGAAAALRERSKVLVIALPDEPDEPAARGRVAEIAQAYKRAFRQDSVLTALTPSCVSF